MPGTRDLARLFELQRLYAAHYDSYLARGINRTLDPDDFQNRFADDTQEAHYLEIGADAIRLIVGELLRGLRNVPEAILDFPCGAGRVTRHRRAFFPQSRVFACDLYDQHVNFCVGELGAEGLIAEATVAATGFGFVDYDHAIRSKFDRQARYGIALSRPHWVLKLAEQDEQVRVLGFTERGWDNHQDVLVIGKPAIND